MPGYTVLSRGTDSTPLPRRGGFTHAPVNSRLCGGASLGSEPRQPTNQTKDVIESVDLREA